MTISNPQPAAAPQVDTAALLESYSNGSWHALALAHAGAGAPARAHLPQELSLIAAACAAFSTLAAGDVPRAASELSLVAPAARQQVASGAIGAGLSAPGAVAVQLLAAAAPPLCHPRGSARPSSDMLEATFMVLEALSGLDQELSAHLAQLRSAALSAPPVVGPDAELRLMKQQAAAQQALSALAGLVERNQQLLATMMPRTSSGGSGGAPAAAAAPQVSALSVGSPPLSASPSRHTPLASYFATTSGSTGGSGPLDGVLIPGADAAAVAAAAAAQQHAQLQQLYSPQQQLYSPLSSPLAQDLSELLYDPSGAVRRSSGGTKSAPLATVAQLHGGNGGAGGGGGGGTLPLGGSVIAPMRLA